MKKPSANGMTNKNDIKLFILFLLDNINCPLDYDTIHDITVYDGYVGGFDFAECFAELLERELVIVGDDHGDKSYAISPKGHLVATELQSSVVEPIRRKSLKSAMRIVSFKVRGSSAECTYSRGEDGNYIVSCEIKEGGRRMMDAQFSVSSEALARAIKEKFNANPEGVYRGMLAVFTGEIDYLLS